MAIKPNVFKKLTKALANKVVAGHYEVAFARSQAEIEASQELRYKVLFKEGNGKITDEMLESKREVDQWDEYGYHVIVIDKRHGDIVGCVRFVSTNKLPKGMKSYTEQYFDMDKLLSNYQNPLELSRACVSAGKRDGVVLLLIWKFAMEFINQSGFDMMFGCASFSSTNYMVHAPILHYLRENNLAPAELMPKPIVDSHIKIQDIDFDEHSEENKKFFGKRLKVPTLLRGYLKLGAKVSDSAIIDPEFNTTFLCIYVDSEKMQSIDHVLVKNKD